MTSGRKRGTNERRRITTTLVICCLPLPLPNLIIETSINTEIPMISWRSQCGWKTKEGQQPSFQLSVIFPPKIIPELGVLGLSLVRKYCLYLVLWMRPFLSIFFFKSDPNKPIQTCVYLPRMKSLSHFPGNHNSSLTWISNKTGEEHYGDLNAGKGQTIWGWLLLLCTQHQRRLAVYEPITDMYRYRPIYRYIGR